MAVERLDRRTHILAYNPDNALFFSTGRAGPTIWELRRICRRCAGAGVTDDRQYATAPHVCSITYRYAYTETYYMQFL